MWSGKTVFIIGGGSSIPKEFNIPNTLIDNVKEGINTPAVYNEYMKPIHNEIVIGVNKAYLLGSFIDCIFFGDDTFLKDNEKAMRSHGAEIVTCNKRYKNLDYITYIPKDKRKHGISDTDKTICWNDNSGAAAINLAINRGAKRIILLGFDMKSSNGQTHFHNEYKGKSKPPPFIRHLKGFEKIATQAKTKGVEIINCSSDTAIKEFKTYKLLDIIKKPLEVVKNALKIGAIIPTCSKDRKKLLEFNLQRIKEQTHKVDNVYLIDYPNTSGGSDIAKRYKEGISKAFDDGCDLVFFIEDDDYYPVNYIEQMVNEWEKAGKPCIIGVTPTVYYHIQNSGYKIIPTHNRSSAFCTAVAKGVNYKVGKDDDPYYDIQIWKHNIGKVFNIKNKPIGIKHGLGLCGGNGHKRSGYTEFDNNRNILKKLIDDKAYDFYAEMFFNKDRIDVLAISFVYNELKYLPMAISYYQQQGCKVYVIDNMSTDGTYEWLVENNIPCHRHATQGAFQLEWLQAEMIRTIHLIRPKWFLRFDADMFQVPTTGTIVDMINRANKLGHNQVKQRVFRYRNTGESEHHNDMYNHYRYAVDDKTNICFITKYSDTLEMRADCLKLANSNPYKEGIMLEYGGCKPKVIMNEKLARREKAWKLGTPLGHGTHYREGVKKGWIDDPATLTDTWKDKQGLEHVERLQKMNLSKIENQKLDIKIADTSRENENKQPYTVIIPTMWASNYIFDMLTIYENEPLIEQVIVIDNAPEDNKNLSKFSKVLKVTKGKNIYVNNAWNWGVELSKTEKIIIANDDILFSSNDLHNILKYLQKRLADNTLIGFGADCFTESEKHKISIQNIDKMNIGYGTFMIMNRKTYTPIPEDLLIWRGDVIQWEKNETLQITGIKVQTPHSTTIKREGSRCIGEQDIIRAKKYDFKKLERIKI